MTAEERMMWVERYSALPTGNVADAMDGLGLKRGSVLGLHPIDPSQKRAAGFARTILQKRRSTPWDGVNLAKHGKVIDDKTEPGDLLVISMGGIMNVSTGGDLLALRAQAAFWGAVLFAAVQGDHLADQQLFLCAFFVQILRGLRHRVRSS